MSTYELSQEQYKIIWSKYNINTTMEFIDDRKNYWNQFIQPKYKLQYIETNYDTDSTVFSWYGMLKGNKKHINWFLLQL